MQQLSHERTYSSNTVSTSSPPNQYSSLWWNDRSYTESLIRLWLHFPPWSLHLKMTFMSKTSDCIKKRKKRSLGQQWKVVHLWSSPALAVHLVNINWKRDVMRSVILYLQAQTPQRKTSREDLTVLRQCFRHGRVELQRAAIPGGSRFPSFNWLAGCRFAEMSGRWTWPCFRWLEEVWPRGSTPCCCFQRWRDRRKSAGGENAY